MVNVSKLLENITLQKQDLFVKINVQTIREYLFSNRDKIPTYVKVIEATKCKETGKKLITFEAFFPRYILAEQNTHRVFSRNTGSSRAIPVLRMLVSLMKLPVIPLFWGLNKNGMQSAETMPTWKAFIAHSLWRTHAWFTYFIVFLLAKLGLHKQWTNRLLEPHTYIRQVFTSSDYENYFHLRLHDDAQPEIIVLALLAKEQEELLDRTNGYRKVSNNDTKANAFNWHLPYITEEERTTYKRFPFFLAKLSAARCARTSYLTQEGMTPNPEREIGTFKKLAESVPIHASPLEHQAFPAANAETRSRNFEGFIQYRAYYEEKEFGAPIVIPKV